MPQQSLLRVVKHWRRYATRDSVRDVPAVTRGVYVLYRQHRGNYEVTYIGVAGLSVGGKTGIASRLRSHDKSKKRWTHYSVFEVHDNVTRDEIRELEALLLGIFEHDARIQLANTQLGSKKLRRIRVNAAWKLERGTV